MQSPLGAFVYNVIQYMFKIGNWAHLVSLLVGDALVVPAGVAAGVPLGLLGAPGLEGDALLSSANAEVLQRQSAAVLKHSPDSCSTAHASALQCTLFRPFLGPPGVSARAAACLPKMATYTPQRTRPLVYSAKEPKL